MKMEDVIYNGFMYLNCVFEVFLLFYLFSGNGRLRRKKRECLLIGAGTVTVIYAVNSLKQPLVNLLLVPAIYYIFVWLIYRLKVKQGVLYVGFYYLILAGSEFVFFYIYRLLGIDTVTPGLPKIQLMVVQNILRFLIAEGLRRSFRPWKLWRRAKDPYLDFVFLIPVSTLILLNGFLCQSGTRAGHIWIVAGGICLLAAEVAVFYIVEKLMRKIECCQEKELMNLRMQLEQKNFENLKEMNEENARLLHELRRILSTARELALRGDGSALKKLAEEVSDRYCEKMAERYTEDIILNAVLTERRKAARDAGIRYEIMLHPAADVSFIEDMDKIILFGNLLDNALEAAAQTDHGFVRARLFKRNEAITVFEVKNNFAAPPQKKGAEYSTTKTTPGHGYGLKNVREVAVAYGGNLLLDEQEGKFCAVLMLSSKVCYDGGLL